MKFLTLPYWPIWVACAVMVYAGFFNLREGFRLPNRLTFAFAGAGALLGTLHTLGVTPDAGVGGIEAVVVCMAAAFVFALPMYLAKALGAGTLKLQMAWSAWLGAFYGRGPGIELTFWSLLLAAASMGITYLVMRKKSLPTFALRFLPTAPAQCAGAIAVVIGVEVLRLIPLVMVG